MLPFQELYIPNSKYPPQDCNHLYSLQPEIKSLHEYTHTHRCKMQNLDSEEVPQAPSSRDFL